MAYWESYEEFTEKFKHRMTTDDCYTPEPVYEVVKRWAVREYGIDENCIVRPLYPGGDYERYEYPKGCVVLDNPPFSKLKTIIRFYDEREIDYFLFAPTLTILSTMKGTGASGIISAIKVKYENGATVNTSFVSNMEPALVRSAPVLRNEIERAQREQKGRKTPAKRPDGQRYEYPEEVLRSMDLEAYSKAQIDFRVSREEGMIIWRLDEQRAAGKELFGRGVLLSQKGHKARAAADARLREARKVIRWELSERERKIVDEMSKKGAKTKSHDILTTAHGADMKRACGNSMRKKWRMNELKMQNNVF